MRGFTTVCTCDLCGVTNKSASKQPNYRLPEGWKLSRIEGHTACADLCPSCAAPLLAALDRINAKEAAK